MNSPGLYGKLPAHGDFVQRNLPSAFVQEWDPWLQHLVAGAREKIGEPWLDIYLTSPIWRFALSHGVIDANHWAGIVLPSVDQVGRYFPFSIIMQVGKQHHPAQFLAQQSAWFSAIEDLALSALEGELSLDELVDALEQSAAVLDSAYQLAGAVSDSSDIQLDMGFEEQSVMSAYPALLDALLARQLNSYSVWSTDGSERVAPCVFSVQGLPSVSRLPAMLDGRWQYWGWRQPYVPAALDNHRGLAV